MSFKNSIFTASYLPMRFTNNLLRQIGIKLDARLRIVNYHHIAANEQHQFESQLRWMARSWSFVSPQRFAAMISGEEKVKGSNLLLTFDDGFASNRRVAEEVLKPMGIQALFFVVPDFVNFDGEDYRAYINSHFYPNMNRERVPECGPNMTWNDLAWLIENGHTIGNHTRTHARLSELNQENVLYEEIIESANELERNLGVKIEHFAYPFGNLASFSPAALALARRRFPFIYTGLRGDNINKADKWSIRRDVIQTYDSLYYIGAILEGVADFYYKKSISIYNSWCN